MISDSSNHADIPNDTLRHDASRRDVTPLVVTPHGNDEYIPSKDAYEIFHRERGLGSLRTIQRKCGNGSLICKKMDTNEGQQWLVSKLSLTSHIKELDEFDKVRGVASRRDVTPPVANEEHRISVTQAPRHQATSDVRPLVATPDDTEKTQSQSQTTYDVVTRHGTTRRDVTPPVATPNETVEQGERTDLSEKVRQLYEERLSDYREVIEDYKLREQAALTREDRYTKQLEAKDTQLTANNEQFATMSKLVNKTLDSDRETKTLIGSIQGMLWSLWPGEKTTPPIAEPTRNPNQQPSHLSDNPDRHR